jgi:hypothetical protein
MYNDHYNFGLMNSADNKYDVTTNLPREQKYTWERSVLGRASAVKYRT